MSPVGEVAAHSAAGRTPGVPRLRPGLTVAPGGADDPAATWVWINSRVLRLRGEGARRILAAIDGVRTLDEVARCVGAAPGEVAAAVERLRRFGMLEPEGTLGALPAPLARALADRGVDAVALAGEMARARVAVLGGGALAGAVRSALLRAGVDEAPALVLGEGESDAGDLAGVDTAVAALDAPDPATLGRLNALALARGLPWLLLEGSGMALRLGPFFLPWETACWTCYHHRLEAADPARAERSAAREALLHAGGLPAPADDLAPGVAAVGGELAALEMARFYAARVAPEVAPALWGAFAEHDLWEHRTAVHRVLRLPRCPDCGPRARGLPTVRAWMEPYGYPDGGG